jgi:hypothetical protein
MDNEERREGRRMKGAMNKAPNGEQKRLAYYRININPHQ